MGWFGSPAGLRTLSGALTTARSDLSAVAGALDGRVNRVVPMSWRGAAADAFRSHWDGERSAMLDLGAKSATIARVLDVLATQLEAANRLADAAQAAGPDGAAMLMAAQAQANMAWTQATAQLSRIAVAPIGRRGASPQPASTSWYDGTVSWLHDNSRELTLLGDAASLALGIVGVVASGVMLGVGTAEDATVVGAPVGVATQVAGVALGRASLALTAAAWAKTLNDLAVFSKSSTGPEGPAAPVREFEPGGRDATGKYHGKVPKTDSERVRAIQSWTPEERSHVASELKKGIPVRQAEQLVKGETSISPTGTPSGLNHRLRIHDEIMLERALEKTLSGT
jgi:hypothetical protein